MVTYLLKNEVSIERGECVWREDMGVLDWIDA
jgi:hypothetical protein